MKFPNNIRALRTGANITQNELAKIISRDQSLISKLEKGLIDFDMSMADKLAKIFNVPINKLRPAQHETFLTKNTLQPQIANAIGEVSFGPDTVPIFGHANGSVDAVMISPDAEIGRALRHPNQQGLKNCFALFARGESMSPRYYPGDLIYVVGGKQVSKGQDCVVELNNSESFVKKFTSMTKDYVICSQLQPPGEWKRKLSEVKAIHAIVGRG